MDRNMRIFVGFLAVANLLVSVSTGFIVPNLWLALACFTALCIRPVLRMWRSHRLEHVWNLGDEGRGPELERV